jgi:hypothetical protein
VEPLESPDVMPRGNAELCGIYQGFVGVSVASDELVKVLHNIIWVASSVDEGAFDAPVGCLEARCGPLAEAGHVTSVTA